MSRRRKGDLRGHAATRQLNRIYERDRGICQLCFQFCSREEASRDHVIEWCVGGSSEDSNIVLAHKICNELKSRNSGLSAKQHVMPLDEWWPFMIGREIKSCIKRHSIDTAPVTARVPRRMVVELNDLYCDLPITNM